MILAALALLGCTSSGEGGGEGTGGDDRVADRIDATAGPEPTSPRQVRRPTIRLATTDWTAARLNAAIAERLIELRLGYPVEVVPVDDVGGLFDDLEEGDLDAILELWPSTLEPDERERIESGLLIELGPLGVEAKVGWFVPRYVAEGELAVDRWERLVDPTVARAFATPSSGSQGRFLGTDPAYVQYDEELIDTLGLPFVVDYSGSDEATAAAVDAAVAAGRPILLNWWTPTALVAGNDLVNVSLPARTDDCLAEIEAGGPARCDYPIDRLIKVGSPDLAAKAPEVERFLRAFELTTDDQLGLLDQVENQERPIGEAVEAWVQANRDRWEAWLAAG